MDTAVAYVRDLLGGLDAPWFLCGGWAADAWLGRRTREHVDVDIAVFHHDQAAIFRHFTGWALVGHDPNVPDDTTEPWAGRHLTLPAHIHVPTVESPLSTSPTARHSTVEFEFLLNERSGDDLVLNHERRITVPLSEAVGECPWGVPAFTPEVILFFKAGGNLTTTYEPIRRHDQADFDALLPTLGAARRSWLRESIARAWPGHPWLAALGS